MLSRMGITDRARRNYQEVFRSDAGRYVLSDLCKRYGIFDTMVKSKEDLELLAMREGQRSVLLFIMGILGLDLTVYEQVLDERTEELGYGR